MKTLAIVIATSMAFFSVACGGSTPEGDVPEAAGAEEGADELPADEGSEELPDEEGFDDPAAEEAPAEEGGDEAAEGGEEAPAE